MFNRRGPDTTSVHYQCVPLQEETESVYAEAEAEGGGLRISDFFLTGLWSGKCFAPDAVSIKSSLRHKRTDPSTPSTEMCPVPKPFTQNFNKILLLPVGHSVWEPLFIMRFGLLSTLLRTCPKKVFIIIFIHQQK